VGRTHADLVRRLREAGVGRVLDVRASARSPRPGWSKAPLAKALAAAGIAYRHLPEVGNPFRAEAATDLAGVLARYRKHLAEHPELVAAALAAIEGVDAAGAGEPPGPGTSGASEALASATLADGVALLCAEANPRRCHRFVLAEALAAARPGLSIVHL
jgi:uncharacterized protein (DUF488 family)